MNKQILFLLSGLSSMILNAQTIYTCAGNGAQGYAGDGGAATSATLGNPTRVAVDANGNLYISDNFSNTIRKVNTSGIISTVAGNGTSGFSGDGGQATLAQLKNPEGIAVDAAGNLYIADLGNFRIRKVNTSGVISTFAGNGTGGFSGDGGAATAAQINCPYGLALDAAGNLYIGDGCNNRIRRVDLAGNITTFAGNGTSAFGGDGGLATSAQLKSPAGLAFDAAGNLYIADESNHRIRMVNTSSIITTVAGSSVSGYSGDGGSATLAKLNFPEGVAVDAAGNLYIADLGNIVIRKVNTSSVISTYAGTSVSGFSGDGGPAASAKLANPDNVAVNANGELYISDTFNHRIRKVCNGVCATSVIQLAGQQEQLFVYPNPGSGIVHFKNLPDNCQLEVTDMTGKIIYSENISGPSHTISLIPYGKGIYLYKVKDRSDVLQYGKLICVE